MNMVHQIQILKPELEVKEKKKNKFSCIEADEVHVA
jgi:hypothetical protein